MEFVPISLKELPFGVEFDFRVYFAKSGGLSEPSMTLLCENIVFSREHSFKLKRVIFPNNDVYVQRTDLIEKLFDRGHFCGYDAADVLSIRNGGSPWEKERERLTLPPVARPGQTVPVTEDEKHIQRVRENMKRFNRNKVVTAQLLEKAVKTGKVDKEQSAELADDIRKQVLEVEATMVIQAVNRIRKSDEYLHTHTLNVAYLNGLMGKWLNLNETEQRELVECGLLHDVGKLGIDQGILNKPARLTAEEFEEVKRHPTISMEMLMKSGIHSLAILNGVYQHHEKVNGTGYPLGLKSDEISINARITAISDIYDAMVTKRVYKDPHSPFVILNEFAQEGYSELDIKYINIFINCMTEELKGHTVIMNDGSEAIVLMTNPRNLLFPMVSINGEIVTTNSELYCVRMKV